MVDDKRQKVDWHLLLVGVILGSAITVGAFWITPSDFNRAKNLVFNRVKNLKLETGFGETQVITTSTQKDDQTTISKQIHPKKTLWDVLELSSRLLVPILIFIFGLLFRQRDKKRTEQQAELERGIAKDNLSEEAIQAYLDNMAKLLLDKDLRKELFSYVELKSILDEELRKELSTLSTHDKLNLLDKDNPVKDVARTQTITILRRLEGDKERQTRIIHFLRDAELYEFILKNANLSGINLSQAYLRKANLQKARLESADLQKAYVRKANLQKARLKWANLQETKFKWANLQEVDLREANLQKADLRETNLQEAKLWGANLQEAKLWGAKNLTPQQIKSACFWDKAIYKAKYNKKKRTWVAIEPDNTNYINNLKKDTASDPEEPVYCSKWER